MTLEEHYFDNAGELHVIYLGPSEILDLPTSEADMLDLGAGGAHADLLAKGDDT